MHKAHVDAFGASDAGEFAAEFFGENWHTGKVREYIMRAQHLYEHRIAHSDLAFDRLIIGFFAGRLGKDWAKK